MIPGKLVGRFKVSSAPPQMPVFYWLAVHAQESSKYSTSLDAV